MIYCLYIYSKGGSCLYYREWLRPRNTLADNPDEERKLVFGLLFSLKQLMNKMAPAPLDGPAPATSGSGSGALYTGSSASSGVSSAGPSLPLVGPDQGFYRYACSSSYVLHHLETPTGYRFVLTTDPGVGDLRGALWHLYSEIFVGYALKNPLYQPGTTIDCTGFVSTVDGFIRALPAFGGVGNTGTGGAAIGGAGAVAGAGGGMTRL